MNIHYLKGLCRSSLLEVQTVRHVMDDSYLVYLLKKPDLTWNPGAHGICTLPGVKVKGKPFRAFSIASIPREGIVLLGMRTGKVPSDFKGHLLAMKPGDTVRIRGPFGWFVKRDSHSPMVLIARGVGITPMRALILSADDSRDVPVHLIHRARKHLFRDRFEALEKNNPLLTLTFPEEDQEFQREISLAVERFSGSAYWYLAASPGEVRRLKHLLRAAGIKRNRIITDPFFGYSRSYSDLP